jgi:hypothetical protein
MTYTRMTLSHADETTLILLIFRGALTTVLYANPVVRLMPRRLLPSL